MAEVVSPLLARLRGDLGALRRNPSPKEPVERAVVTVTPYKKIGIAAAVGLFGTVGILYAAKPAFVYKKDDVGQPLLGQLNHLAIWLAGAVVALVVAALAWML